MNEVITHLVEHAADVAALDPALHLAAGIAEGRLAQIIGEERLENLKRLAGRLGEKLKGKKFEKPSLSVSVPLMEAARDEGRDELLDLWASLFATACDADRKQFYRREFVSVVKQMEPLDARILPLLLDNGAMLPSRANVVADRLSVSREDVILSFRNMNKLDLIGDNSPSGAPGYTPHITPFGRGLLRAVGTF